MNITFVCTGNTCRSPMAQALFTQMAQDSGITFTTDSAGLAAMPGQPAAEYAIEACKALGADLSAHRSLQKIKFIFFMFQTRLAVIWKPTHNAVKRSASNWLFFWS